MSRNTVVLPYLFDSDLQYNLRQGQKRAFNGYCDRETEQLITMPVKLAML